MTRSTSPWVRNTTSLAARGPCAAGGVGPALPWGSPLGFDWLSVLVLLVQTHQLRGFITEAAQFLVRWLVLVHPLHRPVVPRAGLVLLAELPVGHREKKPVVAVAAFA